MSIMGFIVSFTVPIVFAVLMNELKGRLFKRSIQTISYLPHFVSWVVVASSVTKTLSTEGGVNELLLQLHLIDQPVQFMAKGNWFWGIVIFRYVEGNRLELDYFFGSYGGYRSGAV